MHRLSHAALLARPLTCLLAAFLHGLPGPALLHLPRRGDAARDQVCREAGGQGSGQGGLLLEDGGAGGDGGAGEQEELGTQERQEESADKREAAPR